MVIYIPLIPTSDVRATRAVYNLLVRRCLSCVVTVCSQQLCKQKSKHGSMNGHTLHTPSRTFKNHKCIQDFNPQPKLVLILSNPYDDECNVM